MSVIRTFTAWYIRETIPRVKMRYLKRRQTGGFPRKRGKGGSLVVLSSISATHQISFQRFGCKLDRTRLTLVYLNKREWVEAVHYPRFTLLLQSLGSLLLGAEALGQFTPDIFLDTMGYAFVLPLAGEYFPCKGGMACVFAEIHPVRSLGRSQEYRCLCPLPDHQY